MIFFCHLLDLADRTFMTLEEIVIAVFHCGVIFALFSKGFRHCFLMI